MGKLKRPVIRQGRAKPPESESRKYDDDFPRRYRYRQIEALLRFSDVKASIRVKHEEIPAGTIVNSRINILDLFKQSYLAGSL